jgi:hypothetical protein
MPSALGVTDIRLSVPDRSSSQRWVRWGRGLAARRREAGRMSRGIEIIRAAGSGCDLRKLPLTKGAGDGNRTRTINLEG